MPGYYQTLANVFEDVRYAANKDSTTLSDTDLLRLANKYYLMMFRELVNLDEGFYAEISTTDLTADQQEYPLPADDTGSTYGGGLIKIHRVEVSYNGSDWYLATPTIIDNIPSPIATTEDVNDIFDKTAPTYWINDRSLWLAPVPETDDSVAVGNDNLRIYWVRRPQELSGTSSIPDLPKDFLGIMAEGILTDVFRKYGRNEDLQIAQTAFSAGIEQMKQLEANLNVNERLEMRAARKNYA